MTEAKIRENPLEAPKIAPGPKGYPVLGVIPKMGGDPLGFFVDTMNTFGDVARLRLGPAEFFLVTHPEAVKHVLQDNNRNYAKGYDEVKPLIGNGLVSSEGSFWRRQRRLIQPAFHRSKIASFARIMVETTREVMESWRPAVASGQSLDLSHEFIRITQQIIARTMFSTDVGDKIDSLLHAFDVGLEYMNQRMFSPIRFIDRLPTPTNIRFRKALATLDEVMFGLIDERRRAKNPPDDLLTMLLAARDEETGEGMSDQQLRDEVITIFFAGHETTASTLSWTCYLLANHAIEAEKLYAETQQVLDGRLPTIDDFRRLSYTRLVIDESLRLYPPAWMFAREAIANDVVNGYFIPAGASILVSPYATHRHPGFWENPERFDPERFTPDRSQDRHRMAYFPFGGGPRLCIGKEFALVEGALILAMVAGNYKLSLAPGAEVKAQPIATLRPRPSVPMVLTPHGTTNQRSG